MLYFNRLHAGPIRVLLVGYISLDEYYHIRPVKYFVGYNIWLVLVWI